MPTTTWPLLWAAAVAAQPPQTVAADRIADAARTALVERLRTTHPAAAVELLTRVGDQRVPAGRSSLRVLDVAGPWPRPRVPVGVQLLVDGRPVRTVNAWFAIRDPRQVPVYAEAYAAGTPAERVRTASATVDMACCVGPQWDGAAGGDVARLSHRVAAGAPAMAADFELRPEVAVRERVAIEVVHGPVRLHGWGTALKDGRIGEKVPVRSDASQQIVDARVVAKQKVQIDG